MAVGPPALAKQAVETGTLTATTLACASVTSYYCFLLSKYLASRTADMIYEGIFRLASSPTEVALLTLLALWFVSWSLDRHTRAAQLFSTLHLRLLGAALIQTTQQRSAQLRKPRSAVPAQPASSCVGKAVREAAAAKEVAAHDAADPFASHSTGTSRRLSLPPSPGKEIASFRLPDHSSVASSGNIARRRAAGDAGSGNGQSKKQQQRVRWSLDAVGGGQHRRQQVRTQPKPRTSVDFDAAPASPTRRHRQHHPSNSQPQRHVEHRGASLADHRASPQLDTRADAAPGSSAQGQEQRELQQEQHGEREARWSPRMQRIASGQELAELAAGGGPASSRSSMEAGPSSSARGTMEHQASAPSTLPVAALPEQPATVAGPVSSGSSSLAATVSAAALSSWLPALSLSLAWPPSPSSTAPAPAPATGTDSPVQTLPADGAANASNGASCISPFSPSLPSAAEAAAAAAAVARRVAASGTACAAWASSTVDTVLGRAPSAGAALLDDSLSSDLPSPLQHAASAPLQQPVERAAVSGSCSAADRRRQSLDGASARHYSHGGVTAEPARTSALEKLARSARLQSCSAHALGGSSAGSSASGPHLEAPLGPCVAPDAGSSALASIGLDGDCPQEIRKHVTDEHLLQFAAVVGDGAAAAAAAELGLPPAWANADCLMGAADGGAEGFSDQGWEQMVDRDSGGLSYQVWRQALRGGLYAYRSHAVFQGVSPRDLRPFHLDDHARHMWDEAVLDIGRVKPESQPGRLHKHSEWCLHRYRSRFPRPMAAREYQYARRVWHRPTDGGCYVVCRGLPLPDAGDGYRAVRVTDMVSGCLLRALPGSGGASSEMVTLYFDDAGVRPSLAKMAVKGMWGYMQSYEAALRVFSEARQAAAAEYAAASTTSATGGSTALPVRRRSLDQAGGSEPAARRRRRPLLPQLAEAGGSDTGGNGEESDGGSSSGDDALHSTYAAMARRLRRGVAGPSRLGARGGAAGPGIATSRWAGRLMLLAGIKMVHSALTSARR